MCNYFVFILVRKFIIKNKNDQEQIHLSTIPSGVVGQPIIFTSKSNYILTFRNKFIR